MGLLGASYLILLVLFSSLLAKFSNSPLKWQFDPMTLFASVWIIGYLIYALPIFTFREAITLEATLYVMAAHTVFFLGTLFGSLLSRGPQTKAGAAPASRADNDTLQLSFRLLAVIGMVGLLGLASVFIDGILTSSISLAQRLEGGALNEVRSETFARAAGLEAQGPLVRLNQFVAAAFLFVGLMLNQSLARFGKLQRIFLIFISGVSVSMVIVNQLLIRSGRMDIVILILFITFTLALSPNSPARAHLFTFVRKNRVAFVMLGLPALVAVLYFLGVVFVQGRSGGVSPLYSLYAYHRLGLSDFAESLVANSPLLQTAVLSLSYFVVPLTTHSFYFGLSDARFSELFWGQYNFQYITGFVMRYSGFGLDWNFFWSIRDKVWEPLRFLGYGTNVWATILRDLAIDFGWAGTLVAMFVIGVATKWLALKAVTGRDPALIVAYVFAAVFLVFSFAISTFYIPSVLSPFVYAMLLHYIVEFRKRVRSKPPRAFRARQAARPGRT